LSEQTQLTQDIQSLAMREVFVAVQGDAGAPAERAGRGPNLQHAAEHHDAPRVQGHGHNGVDVHARAIRLVQPQPLRLGDLDVVTEDEPPDASRVSRASGANTARRASDRANINARATTIRAVGLRILL
jgi:hypothetical protein